MVGESIPLTENGGADKKFKSSEEEISYIRERLFSRESAEREKGKKLDAEDRRNIVREEVQGISGAERPYDSETSAAEKAIVLDLPPEEHDIQVANLFNLLKEAGFAAALRALKKINNPHIEDDFHRALVEYLAEGYEPPRGLKRGSREWKVFNFTLFEISFPEEPRGEEAGGHKALKELLSVMEQFYAGMKSIGRAGSVPKYFSLELALPAAGEEVSFFAAVPSMSRELFVKQVLSAYPRARVEPRRDDYNIFNESGESLAALARFSKHSSLPLKIYEDFDYDPLNILISAFENIQTEGEGAAVQFVVNVADNSHTERFRKIITSVSKGDPLKEALKKPETVLGEFGAALKDVFWSPKENDKKEELLEKKVVDEDALSMLRKKVATPVMDVNIRVAVSAAEKSMAERLLEIFLAAFNQFEEAGGNKLVFEKKTPRSSKEILKQFIFREFSKRDSLALSTRELVTLCHFPSANMLLQSQLKQLRASSAPAPPGMPQGGTLLGINRHHGRETKIFISPEDRLRHLYIIGQTGTGKSTLLKNMVMQDIEKGEGVAMIDPHGSDVDDVLSIVPNERINDVIYFDPAYTARPMALNMLEYDERFPEQKTFVVNELMSIFRKLFGAIPESMGPAFEQYFRNATLLALEHTESGSTLVDVSRVLADKRFRDLKLSHNRNPLIAQFWRNAEATSGEQALANFVQYVTSKFDVFLSNDIMRPVVAQQTSSFNFRKIMDERKILLVNLSKGRLGDINSNLIGLVLVGKILMAALSRADSISNSNKVTPFYLYLDEFQNITTDSIAVILSEARKYGLSLTIAHQFIAQLTDSIRDAVFGNVGSTVSFRVGAEDAEILEKQFTPHFDARDLMNIENRHAVVRLLSRGTPIRPFNLETLPMNAGNRERVESLKRMSYYRYGRPKEEVEAEILKSYSDK